MKIIANIFCSQINTTYKKIYYKFKRIKTQSLRLFNKYKAEK